VAQEKENFHPFLQNEQGYSLSVNKQEGGTKKGVKYGLQVQDLSQIALS
jgi:hypothetical protein